jgi:hypothetical protein
MTIILALAFSLATARDQAITLAKSTLGRELGTAASAIELVSAVAASWPDGSLGCPEEGKSHDPAATSGYRVVLDHDGRIYAVHVAGRRAVVCYRGLTVTSVGGVEQVRDPEPQGETLQPPLPSVLQGLVEQAREDLARRLSTPVEEIDLATMKSVVWPDSSLGCPQPEMNYAQVMQEGYWIRLRAKGRAYDYHGGGIGPPFLCEKRK